jgi:hypothetical protein
MEVLMKKVFVAGAFCAVLLILFTGCVKSPSAVTKEFIGAIQNNDMGKIQSYTTDETSNIFAAFGGMIKEQLGSGQYTVVKEAIDGNTAQVTIKTASGDEQTFDLVKINNEWKITLKK